MEATVGPRLRRELAQQLARERGALAQSILVGDANAIHPDAVHADGVGGEARLARGQIVYAPVRAAVHRLRIEEEEVGVIAGLQGAAVADAIDARRMSGQAPRGLLERKHATLARPAPEEVQSEPGVVEEREMRAR